MFLLNSSNVLFQSSFIANRFYPANAESVVGYCLFEAKGRQKSGGGICARTARLLLL